MLATLKSWLNVNKRLYPASKYRFTFDTLEKRDVPAFIATWDIDARVLQLEGTNAADTVVVTNFNGSLLIDGVPSINLKQAGQIVGQTGSVPETAITKILAKCYGGNDYIAQVTIRGTDGGGSGPLTGVPLHAFGGSGNDTLIGSHGNDILIGDNGTSYNSVTGLARNTLAAIVGGRDVIEGGYGVDHLYGEGGADSLNGGSGNDYLFGGHGNDRVLGGDNDDTIYGEGGHDFLVGDNGTSFDPNTHLALTTPEAQRGGHDFIRGGSGNDRLLGEGGHDTLYGQLGNDEHFGGYGNDGIFGGEGFNVLTGEAGADRLLIWVPTNRGLAAAIPVMPEYADAQIRFWDTTQTSQVGTMLNNNVVPMRYRAANWQASEIEQIDVGLKWMHEQTGNTRLLKDNLGVTRPIMRYGSYIPWVLTDQNQDGFIDQQVGVLVTDAGAANNFSAGAWNLGSAGLAFTSTGIASGASYLSSTIIHELAHNWDSESVFWGWWGDLSGWVRRIADANGVLPAPGEGQSISGDGGWFYNTNGQFAENYSRHSPFEDWTTTFEAYYQFTQGTLDAATATALATKLDFIDAFIDSMKS